MEGCSVVSRFALVRGGVGETRVLRFAEGGEGERREPGDKGVGSVVL